MALEQAQPVNDGEIALDPMATPEMEQVGPKARAKDEAAIQMILSGAMNDVCLRGE